MTTYSFFISTEPYKFEASDSLIEMCKSRGKKVETKPKAEAKPKAKTETKPKTTAKKAEPKKEEKKEE